MSIAPVHVAACKAHVAVKHKHDACKAHVAVKHKHGTCKSTHKQVYTRVQWNFQSIHIMYMYMYMCVQVTKHILFIGNTSFSLFVSFSGKPL